MSLSHQSSTGQRLKEENQRIFIVVDRPNFQPVSPSQSSSDPFASSRFASDQFSSQKSLSNYYQAIQGGSHRFLALKSVDLQQSKDSLDWIMHKKQRIGEKLLNQASNSKRSFSSKSMDSESKFVPQSKKLHVEHLKNRLLNISINKKFINE